MFRVKANVFHTFRRPDGLATVPITAQPHKTPSLGQPRVMRSNPDHSLLFEFREDFGRKRGGRTQGGRAGQRHHKLLGKRPALFI